MGTTILLVIINTDESNSDFGNASVVPKRLNQNIYALLTKREVKMAGYWPSSFFAFLWTKTKSRSIKTQKKNEANIQPS